MGYVLMNPKEWYVQLAVACFCFQISCILNLGIYLIVSDLRLRAVIPSPGYILESPGKLLKHHTNALSPKNTRAKINKSLEMDPGQVLKVLPSIPMSSHN